MNIHANINSVPLSALKLYDGYCVKLILRAVLAVCQVVHGAR